MPSSFSNQLFEYTSIASDHVLQFANSLNHLESGLSFFRVATNTGATYEVDFSSASVSGGKGNVLFTLIPGQVLAFRASADNVVGAKLEVTVEGGKLTLPLLSGNEALHAKVILQGQVVVVVYNDSGIGHFDAIGLIDNPRIAQLQNLTLNEGDLITLDSSDELVVISSGNDGDVLTMDQNAPVWQQP